MSGRRASVAIDFPIELRGDAERVATDVRRLLLGVWPGSFEVNVIDPGEPAAPTQP